MRALSFPKLTTSIKRSDEYPSSDMPSQSWHTRDSSSASSSSSPITSTFSSTRSHNRWPSSSSSITTPDSPANAGKAALEDLVEEAAEREDGNEADVELFRDFGDEPLCICDSAFCEHQRQRSADAGQSAFPEWRQGDDAAYSFESQSKRSIKRTSSEISNGIFAARRSRRAQSILSRLHNRKPTISLSSQSVRSAPSTPASFSRRPSASQSLANSLEPRQTVIFANSQFDSPVSMSRAQSIQEQDDECHSPERMSTEDPIDREGLSSTPLLPTLLTERFIAQDEAHRSPLQSPSVASYSETASLANLPLHSPIASALPTPPLSAKASVASISAGNPHLPPREPDYWSIKLGHANFEIEPAPYLPLNCTHQTCKLLLEDWERARLSYMRIATRVNENYGPSSSTYKLTEAKWAQIDDQWRANLAQANAEAEANGEEPVQQCLAETALSKIPSLTDPKQPAKFLNVAEDQIVGPMVQYVKITPPPTLSSRRSSGLWSILRDPTSLFGRSVFGSKRR